MGFEKYRAPEILLSGHRTLKAKRRLSPAHLRKLRLLLASVRGPRGPKREAAKILKCGGSTVDQALGGFLPHATADRIEAVLDEVVSLGEVAF